MATSNNHDPAASSSTNHVRNPGHHHHHHRKLLVIRHGERIDFTFNAGADNWVNRAFEKDGKYRRFNINMPKTVPHRRDGYHSFAVDTPLTEIGYLQAKITGRALKDAGVKPTYIYVSPALRCVQTCVGILKGMNSPSLKFSIEPGLFEWGGWFRPKMPSWLSPDEYQPLGYSVNVSHRAIWPEVDPFEKLSDYYQRSFIVVKKILEKHPEDCTILLVAHGASLDTLTRQLVGKEPRNQHDFYNILHQTSYLACAAVQESSPAFPGKPGGWSLVEPPILPFQHQGNASYSWTHLTAEAGERDHIH